MRKAEELYDIIRKGLEEDLMMPSQPPTPQQQQQQKQLQDIQSLTNLVVEQARATGIMNETTIASNVTIEQTTKSAVHQSEAGCSNGANKNKNKEDEITAVTHQFDSVKILEPSVFSPDPVKFVTCDHNNNSSNSNNNNNSSSDSNNNNNNRSILEDGGNIMEEEGMTTGKHHHHHHHRQPSESSILVGNGNGDELSKRFAIRDRVILTNALRKDTIVTIDHTTTTTTDDANTTAAAADSNHHQQQEIPVMITSEQTIDIDTKTLTNIPTPPLGLKSIFGDIHHEPTLTNWNNDFKG